MREPRGTATSRAEGGLTDLLDQIGAAGAFVRRAGKFSPPPTRRALVPRPDLVASLAGRDAEVAIIAAPAGYGKSTLLAERVAAESRPVAWVTLEDTDNDPVVLLTDLTIALASVEPVDPSLISSLWRAGSKPAATIVSRFGRVLASRSAPFVLVLDDVHSLVAHDALDVLAVAVVEFPPGSALVLAGRATPALPFDRLRSGRRVVQLGARDLAFSDVEAQAMFAAKGFDLRETDLTELLRVTEGWAAALYLASLSWQPDSPLSWAGDVSATDDRLIAEFLKDELLDRLPAESASFLLEASCLQRLSGDVCDAILGRTGSAGLLADLGRENSLVIGLDDRGEWYRLHHLLAELLQAELAAQDPQRRHEVHARASRFFEERRDIDAALHHATRAGDIDRAEAIFIANFTQYATHGRHATVKQWLEQFTAEDLATRPQLAILAGYSRLAAGDGPGAAYWCARAGQLIDRGVAPQGSAPTVVFAILRATLASGPAVEMARDAAYALDRADTEDWRAMCCLLLGAARFMLGEDEAAAALFERGRDHGADSPNVLALCLAHEAVLAVERGEWAEATSAARRARSLLSEHRLEDVANLFLVTAVSSLVEARAGRVAEARADHHRTLRSMPGFLHQATWANLQARVALARASLLLGDRVSARTLLEEAEQLLRRVPDAARVGRQVVEARALLGGGAERPGGPSALTSAERRVLEYLPTHLTLADIADRLYVSRNTVKTQAIAIYRKLDVSSRGAAVDVARSIGLLEDDISAN